VEKSDYKTISVYSNDDIVIVNCEIEKNGKISNLNVAGTKSWFDMIMPYLDESGEAATEAAIKEYNLDLSNLINKRDSNGNTWLINAIKKNNTKLGTIKYLVDHGANVNSRAENGDTAASIAYDRGDIEIYDYLKANGARDFEPKVVQQQAPAPAPVTTNHY
jgi:ankyrin repeat protein